MKDQEQALNPVTSFVPMDILLNTSVEKTIQLAPNSYNDFTDPVGFIEYE